MAGAGGRGAPGAARDSAVVVVGAGLAGLRVVEDLRAGGHRGPLTLIGAEPEHPYDRPPLSKQVLRGERDLVRLRPEGSYGELGVDLRLGVRVSGLDTDARTLSAAGADVSFDTLVIATGAVPRRLPGTDEMSGVHVLRTAADCRALRSDLLAGDRLAIVGGGFIGCEVAASARAMDLDVTVLEALPAPLVRVLGPRVAALVEQMHREHGVAVRAGVAVRGVQQQGAAPVRIELADGHVVEARTVLVGLGVAPDIGWLDGSGVETGDGVRCDAYGETSAPGVFAVGDVARWPDAAGMTHRVEHWTNAVEMAGAVAHNILHPAARLPYAPIPYVWSDQYDRRIQAVGGFAPDDEVLLLEIGKKRRTLALYTRAGRLTGAVGFSAAAAVMTLRRLLAAAQDEGAAVGLDEAVRAVSP